MILIFANDSEILWVDLKIRKQKCFAISIGNQAHQNAQMIPYSTEWKWAIDCANKTCEARRDANRGRWADRVEINGLICSKMASKSPGGSLIFDL